MSARGESFPHILRFGIFELDSEAEQLHKNGRVVRMQPKPFKLLCLQIVESRRQKRRKIVMTVSGVAAVVLALLAAAFLFLR